MRIVKCACGCGDKFINRDSRGRLRKFSIGHVNKGRSNWWSKKPIEEVSVWYCRKISREIYFKRRKKICNISKLKNCSGRIEVHHKDSNIRNSHIKNLISLCARHHNLVDREYIKLENPKNPKCYIFPNGMTIYPNNKQYKNMFGGTRE